ncbi:MAG: hypothetical protein Q9218_001861 [Villophora microphyllina]
MNAARVEGTPTIIDEWCMEATPDGRGSCADQHTKQYTICASHPAIHNRTRRNDFCYINHGNHRGIVPHYVNGYPNKISRNGELRILGPRGDYAPKEYTVEENTKRCKPICQGWKDWNLPVMDPISGRHGIIESRRFLYDNLKDFAVKDGAGEPEASIAVIMTSSHTEILAALSSLRSHPLSIVRLSETVSSTPKPNANQDNNNNVRTSDISLEQDAAPTPSSLASDLSHYKDLFSKLRFSYLEQVTKEKFLRAIVGDPPLIVENAENVELESQLKEIKAVLKEQKQMVARMVEELETRGRQLGRRYQGVQSQTELMQRLPVEIEELEEKCRDLEKEIEEKMVEMGGSLGGGAGMGVEGIEQATREKERQREEVERRLRDLRQKIPEREEVLAGLKRDLKGLEKERNTAVQGAREALKGKEKGGLAGDELEMRGRWLKGCEEGLRGLLGVEA